MEGHRTLKEGQSVTFEIETDAKTGKLRAYNRAFPEMAPLGELPSLRG